ncbi:MAG: 5-deoxy-glucuronate isomerase [Propionibacteriaceae bacterium]|jgi:5-deoxy-glucuronate isomerase|nr:5-deoxy-glucuronate isomerase [Propionibacteriaceae bacterium]
MTQWHYPHPALAGAGWDLTIDHQTPGWQHTGLRVARLDGGSIHLPAADVERLVLPLAGSCRVEAEGWIAELAGRPDVFTAATDLAYLGAGTSLTLTGRGQVAVASAHATTRRPPAYLAADQVPVELRGSGNMSREVRNFGTPETLDAESLIACEVLTPAGNWSSYPPHKHDRELAGVETELEEIYYFQFRTEPGVRVATGRPFGYQRVSASDDRAIDQLVEVHDGDVVLVPFGWHGPSAAAPGYDMFYLNVMAGPGRERAWRITNHPDYAWLRDTWADHPVDPRLPFEHP